MEKIPVFIIDDQNLFRQSLALLIDSIEQFELIGDYEGAEPLLQALPGLVNNDQTYIALVDMSMPGINGVELNRILHETYPQIRVIILSGDVSPQLIAKMIDARASAYMAKNCDKNELIIAIQTVYKTGFYFNREVLKAIQSATSLKTRAQKNIDKLPINLTEREKQIIQLICLEHNNAEIARELYVSMRTVEGHRNNLLTKTGSRNTAGIVLFAIKYGLFSVTV
jgi:DNA-binding NarL/FixJ family response regulator